MVAVMLMPRLHLLIDVPHCLQVINEIADNYKYGVIREYVGHGVGQYFHSAPTIQHHRNSSPGTMKLWQTFTIEPMLVQVNVVVDLACSCLCCKRVSIGVCWVGLNSLVSRPCA